MNEKLPLYNLLEQINDPEDLRKIPIKQLPQVCKELRNDIIKEVSRNPGHFGSSLGTVELTVALHYVFHTPQDLIVWDVGHQAYGHKILTGRREAFATNRQFKGIRPFPSPEESDYDTFACGHASNSISAALGMAVAAQLKGEQRKHVVAVIGDGSMSGGLAFEGLNNASSMPNDLLIILNDNNMSIDNSVGGMKHYLLNLTTTTSYNQLRYKASIAMEKLGLLNDERRKMFIRLGNSLKSIAANQQNMFEGLNIRYFGPIDGHNVKEIIRVLNNIKDMKGPKLLHLHTKKGKGFKPAEEDPAFWHATSKFNPETGERIPEDTANLPPKYQDVFGETLVELARQNDKIVGITAAMLQGTSMNKLKEAFPERTFDVGIAEGHAVTFSGGLAGIVGEDGPTHHGMLDMAALRPIPNLTISSPMNEMELRNLMFTAQLPDKGPFVIRYPRGRGVNTNWRQPMEELPIGKGRQLKDGSDMAVITIGPIGNIAADAIVKAEKDKGLSIAHYDLRFLKPIDTEMLDEIGKKFHHIVTVEDGILKGGMGSAVLEFMADQGYAPRVKRIGLPDSFIEHGTPDELYHLCGMDEEGIYKALTIDL